MITVVYSLLNQPVVKRGIKRIVGVGSLVFATYEVYDLYQIARGRSITLGVKKWEWKHVALIVAKVSVVLSGVVCWPLSTILGRGTIVALNPYQLRHILSFVAFSLGFFAFLLTFLQKQSSKDGVWPLVLYNTFTSRPTLHFCNFMARRFMAT